MNNYHTNKLSTKIFAVVLFPVSWIAMYLYRIVWFDLIDTLVQILRYLFIAPLSSIWLLVTLPFVLVFDIPVGLIVTFLSSIGLVAEICNDKDIKVAIKEHFSKKKSNQP